MALRIKPAFLIFRWFKDGAVDFNLFICGERAFEELLSSFRKSDMKGVLVRVVSNRLQFIAFS